MEELSYYNELIVKLNLLKAEFDKTIQIIEDSKLFYNGFENPIKKVINSLSELKRYGEEHNYDMFGNDSYLKYIYVAYLQSLVDEMYLCLQNCYKYVLSKPLNRLMHKRLVVSSINAYNDYYQLLCFFNPVLATEFYAMLLDEGSYFDFFKPGMFYKFTAFILGEIKELDLVSKDTNSLKMVKYYVDLKEGTMDFNKQFVDYNSLNPTLEEKSKEYHVDFVDLDKNYSFIKEELDNDKDKGNSRTRK